VLREMSELIQFLAAFLSGATIGLLLSTWPKKALPETDDDRKIRRLNEHRKMCRERSSLLAERVRLEDHDRVFPLYHVERLTTIDKRLAELEWDIALFEHALGLNSQAAA
jgi:hypothetical protein